MTPETSTPMMAQGMNPIGQISQAPITEAQLFRRFVNFITSELSSVPLDVSKITLENCNKALELFK